MNWSGRHLFYTYGALGLGAFALVLAQALGGRRALGWTALVLAATMMVTAVGFIVRDRRRGQESSWSPVFLSAFLASLALRRLAPESWELLLLSLSIVFLVGMFVAWRREDREADAIMKEERRRSRFPY
jgi:hypothetical protein